MVCGLHKVWPLLPRGSHFLFADSAAATQVFWSFLDPLVGFACLYTCLPIWNAFAPDYIFWSLFSFRSVTFYPLILLYFFFIAFNYSEIIHIYYLPCPNIIEAYWIQRYLSFFFLFFYCWNFLTSIATRIVCDIYLMPYLVLNDGQERYFTVFTIWILTQFLIRAFI